jgi:hypothetical protein
LAARLCAIPTLLVVLVFFWQMSQPEGGKGAVLSVTKILRSVILVSSGLGAIYLLRWFWWRLTAWGEVGAMITAPTAAYLCGRFETWAKADPEWAAWVAGGQTYALKVAAITALTIGVAALVSLLFPAKDRGHLEAFVARVQPTGWWGPFRRQGEGIGGWLALRFLAGNMILFGFTFALGGVLLSKGWAVVGGNLLLLALGLLLDRHARDGLPPADLGREPSELTASKGAGG